MKTSFLWRWLLSLTFLPTLRVFAFTDADWVSLNDGTTGPSSSVRAMTWDDSGNLYVASYFTFNQVFGHYVAKWDGHVWSPLGSTFDGSVRALATKGTKLYAAGWFHNVGGAPIKSTAEWDGSSWSALGSGINGTVCALVLSGADVYAGGIFDTAGEVAVRNLARWDGQAWSSVGSGVLPVAYNGTVVNALAVVGTNLFVGGSFTNDLIGLTNIAKWDGQFWSAVGGVNGWSVNALVVHGSHLYVGGLFNQAGGVSAESIAKWDGNSWTPLGPGVGMVDVMAMSGTNLYVGGLFASVDGLPVNHIAKWNGYTWSALGSGLDQPVFSLASDANGHLFVGGMFRFAGTNSSPYLAQANVGLGFNQGRFSNLAYSPFTGFSVNFTDASPGQSYRLQTRSSLISGTWPISPTSLTPLL